MPYGWLAKRPELPAELEGVQFDPEMPTRREEFNLAAEVASTLCGRVAFDAGCGHTPERHVLAEILGKLGYFVLAMDTDPLVFEMPPALNVLRLCGPMELARLPPETFDLVTCISVLEHCPLEVIMRFGQQAAKIVKKGGMVVLTADEAYPEALVLAFPDFNFGEKAPDPETHLSPRVGYAVGVKT